MGRAYLLEFTPLEFETLSIISVLHWISLLEFTPLEFETNHRHKQYGQYLD